MAGAAVPGAPGVQEARPLAEWHELSPGELIAEWAGLRAWVTWLAGRYELSVEERLPRCWARHPGLVEELWALKAWREEIYASGTTGTGQAARYWHGMLTLGPGHAAAIAEGVPGEAFASPYRGAIFGVLAAMHKEGRPVDALMADWELAASGLPLHDAPPPGSEEEAGETYAARLASVQVDPRQAITAAYELHARSRENGRQAAPGRAAPEARGHRRGSGFNGKAPARSGGQGTALLRLIQEPPGRRADGPEHGPQQAR